MSCEFIKSKYTGIRYREHSTRKNGIRKDRYFIIRYKINNKDKNEGFGWESEGFSETKAFQALCEIKENIKKGKGFFSLKEKAECATKEKAKEDAAAASERERNITFSELWDSVYSPIYLNNKIPKTQANERISYDKYIKPILGELRIADILPADIERIKEKMTDKAPATINHTIDVIRQVFNAARNAGKFTGDNPASKVVRMKKDNRRIRFLSKEEASILLAELAKCKNINLHDMALLGMYCGLRAGEIFALQWIDINFNTRNITIRDPKGVINRHPNMNIAVFEMLKRRHNNQNVGQLIFAKRNGEQIQEVSNQFQRIIDRLGFNDDIADERNKVVFHTLRHTFASWLAMAGVDIFTIKELMGHSDIKMTQRYMHLAPSKYASAIAVLDEPLPKIEAKTKYTI